MRPVPLAAVQATGFACIVVAVYAVYDGWRALGAVGVGLVAVAELVDRRTHR